MGGQPHVVVIGAGIIGLLAAAACAARGARVTVLERGPIPNPESTSYDQHRVVRALHLNDRAGTRRAAKAWWHWRAVEQHLGERLLVRTGVMTGLADHEVAPATAVLAAAGVRGELLTARAVRRRWPHLRPETPWAVLEPDAGVVLADRALHALADRLADDPRVTLLPHHEVREVDPVRRVVRTATTTWRASGILLTAGVHTRDLAGVTSTRVEIYRQTMLYCRVPGALRAAYRDTPVTLRLSPTSGGWLVPPCAGTRLKLAAAAVCRTVPAVGDRVPMPQWRTDLVEIFRNHLEGFAAGWVTAARDCYYAAADGGGARTVVLSPGVLAHVACGGGSFKFAPMVAEVLARDVLSHGGEAGPAAVDGAGDTGWPRQRRPDDMQRSRVSGRRQR